MDFESSRYEHDPSSIPEASIDLSLISLLTSGNDHFVFSIEPETNRCYWSKNAVEKFRFNRAEVESADCIASLMDDDDAISFRESLQSLLDGQQSYLIGEYLFPLPDEEPLHARVTMWRGDAGEQGDVCVGVISNLLGKNSYDLVTGLPNNAHLCSDLTDCIREETPCGILVVALDSLKHLNNLRSHTFGDEALYTIAQGISKLIPETSTLYRMDGDTFGVLYSHASRSDLAVIFERFRDVSNKLPRVQDTALSVGFSGAACFYPHDGNSATALLRCARIALCEAQQRATDRFLFYTEDIVEKAERDLLLLERMRESIYSGFRGFSLVYQPIVHAETGELHGCEALLRWHHGSLLNEVAPIEFVPILEKNDLIGSVGKWIIETALHQCAIWAKQIPGFRMNVNVSSSQFEDPDFRFFVMDCLCKERLNPGALTLELTESNKIVDTHAVGQAFDFFRSQGIQIAFDDFGTGYASLDIFRVLSADELKIDRSFLERLSYDVTDQKILGHLINMCHSMNMHVCVEGVESTEVLGIVKQMRPMLLQGYLLSYPLTVEEFEHRYLLSNNPKPTPPLEQEEQPQSTTYAKLRPVQPLTMDDLVDNAHAGIFQVGLDDSFTFLTCNEGYRKMLGYTSKEVEEKFKNQALGFVHPDDVEYVNTEIRRQLGMSDTVTIEFRIVRADGSPLWILGSGSVVKGRDGSFSLVVVIIDNDQEKRRTLELEREHKKYKKILASIPTGIKCVRHDEDFTLDYMSPAFLMLLGYNEADLETRFENKYVNLIHEEDRSIVLNDIFEQRKTSNVVTLRYRSPCKDGRLIWMETVSRLCPPDEDGIQRWYSNVVDVTDTITEQEKNRAHSLASRYAQAAENWGEVLFECNFKTDEVTFSSQYESLFGRMPQLSISDEMLSIHPEDRSAFEQALKSVRNGELVELLEIRIRTDEGKYLWCAIHFNEPDRLGDIALAAVGRIRNIDSERQLRDELLAQSQLDPLTGLLNKSTLENRICSLLPQVRQSEHYALYMIDVDDFKYVNDHNGHPFGDHVLKEVAFRIETVFSGDDTLAGRAGGDEFMVFTRLDGDNYRKEAELYAARMVELMAQGVQLDGMTTDVSVSVGIACFPDDGNHFYDLFRRADSALYRAKDLGKNQFSSYSRY